MKRRIQIQGRKKVRARAREEGKKKEKKGMLIEPARTLADEGGFGCESYHEKVITAYKVAKKETELLFGVDRELKSCKNIDVKRNRKRTDGSPISGIKALQQIDEKRYAGRRQETWSLGYGEITSGSFNHLLRYMIYDAPEQLRLREGMSFLDIGSGNLNILIFINFIHYSFKFVY